MMLMRRPSREEKADFRMRPYVIFEGQRKDYILLRVRAAQGHSGKCEPDKRPEFLKPVEKKNYPRLLIHSTKAKFLESIFNLGLLPGGVKPDARICTFLVDATEFAERAFELKPDNNWV